MTLLIQFQVILTNKFPDLFPHVLINNSIYDRISGVSEKEHIFQNQDVRNIKRVQPIRYPGEQIDQSTQKQHPRRSVTIISS